MTSVGGGKKRNIFLCGISKAERNKVQYMCHRVIRYLNFRGGWVHELMYSTYIIAYLGKGGGVDSPSAPIYQPGLSFTPYFVIGIKRYHE